MNISSVHHRMESEYAWAVDEDTLAIRLRAAKGDLDSVTLFYGNRAHPADPVPMASVGMRKLGSGKLFDYFEARFKPGYSRVCYYFELRKGSEKKWYYYDEFHDTASAHRNFYWQVPFIRREELRDAPAWGADAVIYQIFPDCFADGRRTCSKDVRGSVGFKGYSCESRHGGTFVGIRENLDHVSSLGANCIYLNPIFAAKNYHKYDIIDYLSVDPVFGTPQDFRDLVDACHERGIRIVLDGVFNHSGPDFFAFRDLLENQEHSAYRDWYYRVEFPVVCDRPPNYDCFGYEPHMPKLNTGNPEVVDYFCKVGRFWIREFGVDGWRLDVANEVNHDFWRSFRRAVRSEKEDAILIGEIWEDAQPWLAGDQFDSTMNYRFSYLCARFFGKGQMSGRDFSSACVDMAMRYRKEMTDTQMNLLDSHDVSRFLSLAGGDRDRLRMAVLAQMTMPGIPSVYAGDERAMEGIAEEEYRRPFAWKDTPEAVSMTDWYRRLISIRKANPVFSRGDFLEARIEGSDDVVAYIRSEDLPDGNAGVAVVCINASGSAQSFSIVLPEWLKTTGAAWTDLLGSAADIAATPSGIRMKLRRAEGCILMPAPGCVGKPQA